MKPERLNGKYKHYCMQCKKLLPDDLKEPLNHLDHADSIIKLFCYEDVKVAVEWLKKKYTLEVYKEAKKEPDIHISPEALRETMKLIESAFPDLYQLYPTDKPEKQGDE